MIKKTVTRNPFLVFFLLCFIHSVWAISIGWNNLILDDYSTRQTQTALAAFYLLRGGDWLAYEVPFMGAPWALPMEFPLYQWIVALLVATFRTPIDQTGRFVGVCFFYLSLVPITIILRFLEVQKQYCWIFLSIFLASPLYLFWARTFMIESTALFLGLSYLAAVCLYFRYRTTSVLTTALCFGVLAAVVKVTTFAGFLLCVVLLILVHWRKLQPQGSRLNLEVWLPIATLLLLPVLATVSWTKFADAQKILNPLAAQWTSQGLSAWNFGSLAQRLSPGVWITIVQRSAKDLVGSTSFFILLLVAGVFVDRYRTQFFAAIGLFVVVVSTFINLYFIHGYYAYATGIFLIAAVGFVIVGLLEKGGTYKWLGYAVFTFLLVMQFRTFTTAWLPVMSKNQTFLQDTIAAAQKYTQPNDVLLIPYDAWSREIAYYSQRRVLSHSGNTLLSGEQMKTALQNLQRTKSKIGALLLCLPSPTVPSETMRSQFVKTYGFAQKAVYTDANCAIHLPTANASVPKQG